MNQRDPFSRLSQYAPTEPPRPFDESQDAQDRVYDPRLDTYVSQAVEQPPPKAKPAPPPLRIVGLHELLTLNVPPRRHLLYPVIPEQGLCMLFADRGVGKTFVGLHTAYAVASGGSVFNWKTEQAQPVLYVDGEMPFSAMQSRIASIVATASHEPPENFFRVLRVLTYR